ncbi:MAG: type I 3-dehydroquinate dehydratase, partial [Candidatus Micrarchaeota archaeon]|nr:type I 3-dehydroquinate dehydratase [Candidatus Micrarchaeota archaeon]
ILREIMRLGIAGKSIVTLRDIGQGGGYSGKDAEKMAIFEHVLKAGPWMVDAELEFASRNPEFVKMINKSRTKLLVSWHDFAGTPDLDGLLGLAGKMSMISNHVKVVTTAKQVSDLLAIERLRREARASGIDITAFAMGEIGQVSRAISALSGELAYTALRKRAVAPGQMDIEQMNELKGLKKIV